MRILHRMPQRRHSNQRGILVGHSCSLQLAQETAARERTACGVPYENMRFSTKLFIVPGLKRENIWKLLYQRHTVQCCKGSFDVKVHDFKTPDVGGSFRPEHNSRRADRVTCHKVMAAVPSIKKEPYNKLTTEQFVIH